MAEELKLFRIALRIVWALKLKGIEYETVFEDITNKSPLLYQFNPVHAKVPVLVHNGKPICESLVILEYVDETWKQNPLLPQDPYEKALSRFWANFGDDKLMKSIWGVFISQGKEQEGATITALEDLKLLEEQLKEKKFFGGETIGYLDLALGWMVNLLSILEDIAFQKLIDEERFPNLSSWIQRFSDAPVIKECWPPRDKMITKFFLLGMGFTLTEGNRRIVLIRIKQTHRFQLAASDKQNPHISPGYLLFRQKHVYSAKAGGYI